MPYIREEIRAELDAGLAPATVGELSYALQQQLSAYLDARDELRFADLAECIGALEAVKADFTSRVLYQYEMGKLAENGDVWMPSLIRDVMGL